MAKADPHPAALPSPPTLLGGLSIDTFLRKHWQKKPLLIRQALPAFRGFITPEGLRRLAGRDEVNARLVIEKDGDYPWQMKPGPFAEDDFIELPATHWSLLVQDVDKHRRAAADLLEKFWFIPAWRIDDLMISYAPPQGSVGPHLDSYDVFLLQAHGRRRWQINCCDYDEDDFVPGLDLRILGEFTPTDEWILEPGDMLYLPPGVAHHGVALDECLTCSIGFRAPTRRELIGAYVEDVISRFDQTDRYGDPNLKAQSDPGEIGAAGLAQVRRLIRSLPVDEETIADWFGRYLTETGPWGAPAPVRRPLTPAQFKRMFKQRGCLRRSDRCRFAFRRRGRRSCLYVDGRAFELDARSAIAAPLITGRREFRYGELERELDRPAFLQLLCDLYNEGYFSFAPIRK